jgi:DNA-binding response OmpR family regulator
MAQTLLIVEDDPAIMEILKYLLADSGFNTISSQYGEDVDELIDLHQPELVLMDIRLGKMDGREICRSIKSHVRNSKIPVILMSAHAVAKDILNEACADAFISKPFDIDYVVNLIKKTIEIDNITSRINKL